MNVIKLIYAAAALIAVSAVGSAQAHRLNVFAYPQADQVCAEAKFANGTPARGAEVNFINDAGESILKAVTSDEGKVCIALPAGFKPASLTVVVDAGAGHQNRWKISREEFSAAEVSKEPLLLTYESKKTDSVISSDPKLYTQKDLDDAVLLAKEDQETKVIVPLRRELAQAQNPEISLRDIVGGLGWLIGLGGIFAWLSARRKK